MGLVFLCLSVEVAFDVCSHGFEVFTFIDVLSFKFFLVLELLECHLNAHKDRFTNLILTIVNLCLLVVIFQIMTKFHHLGVSRT